MSTDLSRLHPNELRSEAHITMAAIDSLLGKGDHGRLSQSDQRRLTELEARADDLLAEIDSRPAESRTATDPPKPEVRSHSMSSVTVGHEPTTYREGGTDSYFRDLALRQIRGDLDAAERIARHRDEINTDVERRDLNRTDTTGGEFTVPTYLNNLYGGFARAGRVTADLVTPIPLPEHTDSLVFPRITTGAATAIQTADNAAVQETDMVTATVTAPVQTIAGQQDISLQLLEQSTPGMDAVIFRDLLADYNQRLDLQVLAGTGINGQVTGMLVQSGTLTTAYTDGSPTLPELWPKVASAISAMATQRFLPPEAIVMHPRRWMWAVSQLDSQNRPYVVASDAGANNAQGIARALDSTGPVGTFCSLPVFLDSNVPTTYANGAGTGGTEDKILIGRFSDHLLAESPVKTRVLPDVLSGTLTVRLQVYAYVSFTAGRFPKSTSIVYDTGLVAPTF